MHEDNDSSTLVVLDGTQCLIADAIDNDTALTIVALISDDPSTWEEALSVWPRYRSPPVCEFLSTLPLENREPASIASTLSHADAWVVIDFNDKRILAGGAFPAFGRDVTFKMSDDEHNDRGCSVSIHLPPWWELHENEAITSVNQPRVSPITKPLVSREVLYGEPFLVDIASRILDIATSDAWKKCHNTDSKRVIHTFTVAVHRDWLMTPREDLDGRMPRQLLHGAMRWCDSVVWGQRLRCEDGVPLVAVPEDWEGFDTATMGSQEVCMYFDLCRELIESGWHWCQTNERLLTTDAKDSLRNELVQVLRDAKTEWLTKPAEDGIPPKFIIECDRRRVPWGSGLPIEGIVSVPIKQHILDCDCPICAMMADGMFGIGFTSIDGHHLEMDGEFAFSLCETREEWELEQDAFGEFYEGLEDDPDSGADGAGKAPMIDPETDEFASAWSGIRHDAPIPGDRGGIIKMAFMIGEIVSILQAQGAQRDEIRRLNEDFADYRRAGAQCAESATRLRDTLRSISDRYPELIARSADLQSRIDENARDSAINAPGPDDPL